MELERAQSFLTDMGIKYVVEKADVTTLGLSDEELAELVPGTVVKLSPDVGTSYMQTKDAYVTIYYYE